MPMDKACSVEQSDVVISAPGDWELAGSLYTDALNEPRPNQPVVMISSAAGVPRWFYANFAGYLVQAGCAAVVTYDYRGIAGSAGDRSRWPTLHMKDWALLDFPAVCSWMRARYPNHHLIGVGHSYGGQALGLSGVADRFARFATVATMSGYWADLDEPRSVWLRTQVFGRLAVKLMGYVPKAVSPGEAMPGTIFVNWADWIRKPDYFFSDPDLPEVSRFSDVTLPYLSIGLSDDPWGTHKAVTSFMDHYDQADLRQIWLQPTHSGEIGHLGFFRKRHEATHWPVIRDFVICGTFPDIGSG